MIMMVQFKWSHSVLVLIAMLQCAAARKRLFSASRITLSCENVIKHQPKCVGTTWQFSRSTTTVELVRLGRITEEGKTKSDRLTLMENCSLEIKNLTAEDAGLYSRLEYRSGHQQSQDEFDLSVVSMTEQKNSDGVTLSCSVSTFEQCPHTVSWMCDGEDIKQHVQISQSGCFASLKLSTSHHICKSKSPKCGVKDGYYDDRHLFPFYLRPSDDKPGQTVKKDKTKSTTARSPWTVAGTFTAASTTIGNPDFKDLTTTSTTARSPWTVAGTFTAASTTIGNSDFKGWWWLYVTVAVVSVLFLIIVVTIIMLRRRKGSEMQMDDLEDPENGVSYASISYTKKTISEGQVPGTGDKGDSEAVTYSTLSISPSSANPGHLYATVNKM